jgi:hypothetical protein
MCARALDWIAAEIAAEEPRQTGRQRRWERKGEINQAEDIPFMGAQLIGKKAQHVWCGRSAVSC